MGMSMGKVNRIGIKQARSRALKRHNRIRRAVEAGDPHLARHRMLEYLRSYDAKLAATAKAFQKIHPGAKLPIAKLAEIAAHLDPWKGTKEPARVSARPKSSGGHRIVVDFQLENRALQCLVCGALSPWAKRQLHQDQYGLRDGRDAALEAATEALDEGLAWAVTADVKDFYPSINDKKLQKLLPLPEDVTRLVVISRYLRLSLGWRPLGVTTANFMAQARQGIPQGSAVSSLLAEVVLAPVFNALPEGACVKNYADNFLILAPSKAEACSIVNTLRCACKSLPAGPLRLVAQEPRPSTEWFDFLGYALRVHDGNTMVRPSNWNMERFDHIVDNYEENLLEGMGDIGERAKTAGRYVRSWSAAFQRWPYSDINCATRLNDLGEAAEIGEFVGLDFE